MKTIIFIALIALVAAELNFYYFFEDLDLDPDLTHDNQVKFDDLVDCVLDKGPCTKVSESYKDLFSAAVKEKCQQCTPYQRHLFWLFIKGVNAKSPEKYFNFRQKFDPENKYFDALELLLQHKGMFSSLSDNKN